MFTAEGVAKRLRVAPFHPFLIITSSGERYEIRHPENALVGKRDVSVGLYRSDEPQYYDQVARVSIMHITAMEDLPAPISPGGNGHGS